MRGLVNFVIAIGVLMAVGALFQWVATDWPDTLSGLFFLALIGLLTWAYVRSGYRGRRWGHVTEIRNDVHVHIHDDRTR